MARVLPAGTFVNRSPPYRPLMGLFDEGKNKNASFDTVQFEWFIVSPAFTDLIIEGYFSIGSETKRVSDATWTEPEREERGGGEFYLPLILDLAH